MARGHALTFDRGSLKLEAPPTARVPPYLMWDSRVGAWRTAAIHHARLREDAAAYHLRIADRAERFFPTPAIKTNLPPLRSDQEAAITAWERAGGRGHDLSVGLARQAVHVGGRDAAGRSGEDRAERSGYEIPDRRPGGLARHHRQTERRSAQELSHPHAQRISPAATAHFGGGQRSAITH